MNKIKKINIALIMIVLIICMFTSKTYAELNCNVNLSRSKEKVTYGELFDVYVSISNLQTTKGIIAIGANLSYDTNSLTLVDIGGENKWSAPFHNSSNGKITSFKNELSTNDENVFKITFKVNEKGKASNSAWVKISNFEISDGDEERICGGNSINITIEEPNSGTSSDDNKQEENNSQGGNNQSGNTGNNNQNSGNKPINKPNSGTTKPSTSKPTNGQVENLNNVETSNENNVTTNVIENTIGENSIKNENVSNNNTNNILENNIHNEKTEDNKKSGKLFFYMASIVTIMVIVGILFLMGKHQKMNKKSKN